MKTAPELSVERTHGLAIVESGKAKLLRQAFDRIADVHPFEK